MSEVFTLAEAARVLKVNDKTIYKMAQRGAIPARKIGGIWRVSSAALERFLAGEVVGVGGDRGEAGAESNFPAEKDPRSRNRGRAKGQAIRRAYTDEHREFFREEEESRDVFTVKRVHIRLTGSLEAGALLSQILYWHMPSKKDQLTRCQ